MAKENPNKALPTQGTKALMQSWSDANASVIRSGKKKSANGGKKK